MGSQDHGRLIRVALRYPFAARSHQQDILIAYPVYVYIPVTYSLRSHLEGFVELENGTRTLGEAMHQCALRTRDMI